MKKYKVLILWTLAFIHGWAWVIFTHYNLVPFAIVSCVSAIIFGAWAIAAVIENQ